MINDLLHHLQVAGLIKFTFIYLREISCDVFVSTLDGKQAVAIKKVFGQFTIETKSLNLRQYA